MEEEMVPMLTVIGMTLLGFAFGYMLGEIEKRSKRK
jgi:hypothetical protein